MKKTLLFLALFLIFGILPNITQAIEPPVLDSISPEILSNVVDGKISDIVTINGQNLLNDSGVEGFICDGDDGTTFGSDIVLDWTDSQIRFTFVNKDYHLSDNIWSCRVVHYDFDDPNQDELISNTLSILIKPNIFWLNEIYVDSGQQINVEVGDTILVYGIGLYDLVDATVTINNVSVPILNWQYVRYSHYVAFSITIPDTTSGNLILTTANNFSSDPVYINIVAEDIWECGDWSTCTVNGQQTRDCVLVFDYSSVNTPAPATSQSCTPECVEDIWTCGDWNTCTVGGNQTRSCTKTYDCPLANNSSPSTSQSCTYVSDCTQDTWSCGSWGSCSLQGIQTKSCNKTFDCPTAETASPQTSQYCQSQAQQNQYQVPNQQVNISQASILKATVKLICPLDSRRASQGSGTIINSDGTILTNKHVVDGTLGCLVGFIDTANDQPYFSDRHIADITRISTYDDIATLKLRNPSNRNLTAINISTGNSNVIGLGNKITTYGYPADFGEKVTYTSGDFSGYNGNYLKTTAILEHGNSGGGAYLPNGTFIGIPSAVISGSLNSMGLVLSINKINSWMNNTGLARNDSNNSYARVSSFLEDVDLNTLHLFEFAEADSQSDNVIIENNETLDRERSTLTKIDRQLSTRLKGKILLQVESVGEAWYVSPDDERKYYMKDGPTAYEMMREFGLGITNADLEKIPVGVEERFEDLDSDNDGLNDKLEEGLKTDVNKADTDGDGVSDGDEVLINNTNPLGTGYLSYSNSLVNRLRGKILLQVESRGEAWYINPDDGKRYYMKGGDAAYQIMRFLSLGITNDDLRKIDIGEL